MTINYAERVAKGAALLDEKRPGWERELDLEVLNISSGWACITAQLSGVQNWHAGMMQLELTGGDDGTYVAHGFNAESCGGNCYGDECVQTPVFDTLNRLWRELIEGRLSATAEPAAG